MDPKQTAAALRRIASRIEKDQLPSKRKVAGQIMWVLDTIMGARVAARKSMTLGDMPSEKDFEKAAKAHLPYPMTLRGKDAKAAQEVLGGTGTTFTKTFRTADDLFDFVKGLVAVWDNTGNAKVDEDLGEEAISLASNIMDTLGFEWI